MKEGHRRAECHEPPTAGRFVCIPPRPVPSARHLGNVPALLRVVLKERLRSAIRRNAVSNAFASLSSYISVLVHPRKRLRHPRRFATAALPSNEQHIDLTQLYGQLLRQGRILLRTGAQGLQLADASLLPL